MQLDNTEIAVHERNILDTLDIALHVTRQFALPLFSLFFLGALPLALLNAFLLNWMLTNEDSSFFYLDEAASVSRFLWGMAVLITLEAPLASSFATAYLGQAMFIEHPRIRDIIRDVLRMSHRLVWSQLIVRGVLLAWLIYLALERDLIFNAFVEVFLLGSLLLYALALRFWRPFINEIILLERNPLARGGSSVITAGKRSSQLHGPSSGELFVRGLVICSIAILLSFFVFGTFLFCSGVFLNDWQPGKFAITVVCPLSMWLVACYLTTVRFLNYLDIRIRQEGWEVELMIRAEADRLLQRLQRGLE